jgi:tetratricopeptide (TPR) repeat protein
MTNLDPFAPLRFMPEMAKGAETYIRALLDAANDDILRVGGALLLLQGGLVRSSDDALLIELARFGAVQAHAYAYFEKFMDRRMASAIAAVVPRPATSSFALIQAQANNDSSALADAYEHRYLERGELADLRGASRARELVGGWRGALATYATMMAVYPFDLESSATLARVLESANQTDLLARFIEIMQPVERQQATLAIFMAAVKLANGQTAEALRQIEETESTGKSVQQRYSIGPIGEQLRAKTLHKLGRYAEAYKAYSLMNEADARPSPAATLVQTAKKRNAAAVADIGPANRPDVIMMLGFPRSGTTLLENALAAHPAVETLEEIGSLSAAIALLDQGNAGRHTHPAGSVELHLAARQRYYDEVAWNAWRPDATVHIDKLPVRSIFAPFLQRLIPDQRYIFSIRHPYDVVLSCFQQRFRPNAAMSSFLTIRGAIELYDETMRAWFSVHSLDSPQVKYVRYHDLVTDFRNTVEPVLDFIGLDWDEAIESFAEKAEQRAVRTPSYQKVRQGLSIGVQTYWKNYDFVFKRPEAEPLTKWAKFFGYETV